MHEAISVLFMVIAKILDIGANHGSVLSPLLCIIVLKALSCVLHSGALWEEIYADYIVIITESQEEHVRRLLM